ncbi:hypothetical protein A6J80_17320 [Paracoccus yeei]|uniref:Uncharacterized protein n=1 Tax=Paracoccus yeei TaxID=147645 RepID=A0A1V0GVG0_9RHOB|nr:hypothetical protein [Paracoccus yeei]ARC37875.1 hypothetical protein A6J80_17320 [Paracoccus yeei]
MTCTYLWNGQIYYGAKSVAEAAGVSYNTVSSHLERNGDLKKLGIGRGKRPPRNLVWQGKTYTSVKAVSDASGVSQGYVYRLLSKHGHLERLGAGRWGGKPGSAATCGREKQGRSSTAVQEGATA